MHSHLHLPSCRYSSIEVHRKVAGRLQKMTQRRAVVPISIQLIGREAITYVYQGTVHPRGLLTNGFLRGKGMNIKDARTYGLANKKNEIQRLVEAVQLRDDGGGLSTSSEPGDVGNEAGSSSDDSSQKPRASKVSPTKGPVLPCREPSQLLRNDLSHPDLHLIPQLLTRMNVMTVMPTLSSLFCNRRTRDIPCWPTKNTMF